MRTFTFLAAAAFLLALAATTGTAQAQALMAGTSHDLSGGVDEICVYCHTPHNGDTTTAMSAAPLWNRNITSTTFAMYTSPTIEMTIAGDPQSVSLACLSCHDGATGYEDILNGTVTTVGTMTGARAVGADGLGNDHPISVTYDPTVDAALGFNADNGDGTVGTSSLPLYGTLNDQVECASCHNPHEVANASFLRMNNTGSALCLQCHNK